MAGMVVGAPRPVYPSFQAVQQQQAAYPTELTSRSGSTWRGPNAPRESYTTTPNTLGQEHDYAMEQAAQAGNIANDQMRLKAQLAADAEARRLRAIQGVTGSLQTSQMPGGANPVPGANEEAARAAAFGRAKEQAGNTALASLKALEDVMAARGLRGSTIEGAATADVLTGGAHELNDLVRSQQISDVNRAGQVADRDVAAGLTRRGQDMDYIQSLLGLISAGGGVY